MTGKNSTTAVPAPSDLIKSELINTDAGPPASDDADNKSTLSNHKGKLAIGVAATLGIMVFYSWREKKLAKEDPENYARLQRLKSIVRTDASNAKKEKIKEKNAAQSARNKNRHDKNIDAGASDIESKTDT